MYGGAQLSDKVSGIVQNHYDFCARSDLFEAIDAGQSDGVHLTVWRGIPVTGTRLWSR
jgi:hypothetical protein